MLEAVSELAVTLHFYIIVQGCVTVSFVVYFPYSTGHMCDATFAFTHDAPCFSPVVL